MLPRMARGCSGPRQINNASMLKTIEKCVFFSLGSETKRSLSFFGPSGDPLESSRVSSRSPRGAQKAPQECPGSPKNQPGRSRGSPWLSVVGREGVWGGLCLFYASKDQPGRPQALPGGASWGWPFGRSGSPGCFVNFRWARLRDLGSA